MVDLEFYIVQISMVSYFLGGKKNHGKESTFVDLGIVTLESVTVRYT